MFALIAAVVFLFAMFGMKLGTINLLYLGLFLISLHLAVGGLIPTPWKRNG